MMAVQLSTKSPTMMINVEPRQVNTRLKPISVKKIEVKVTKHEEQP